MVMGLGAGPWAFFGLISGFWKLVLVAAVSLALYGRLGLPRHPMFRLLQPWSSVARPAKAGPASKPPWYQDRWFVFLLVLASTAVVAWIVTRSTVIQQASPTR